MIRQLFVLLFFILLFVESFSQNYLSGKIIDANTKEALPFVNIVYSSTKYLGTSTDIDGNFSIRTSENIQKIKISFLGYKTKTIDASSFVNSKKKLIIRLKPNIYHLPDVVVHGKENPAHRIIKLAIKNREKNNPKSLSSFQYHSYNKMYFTFDVEFYKKEDTINLDNYQFSDTLSSKDSTIQEMLNIRNSQYLFLMESISEKKYKRPNKIKEKIIASRVSGLKNQTFALLGTQLQSFTIYNDYLSVFGKQYLSPLAKRSYTKYLFLIEDTIIDHRGDTIFTLSYRPRKKTNFDGFKGILQINTHGYAVENLTTDPMKENGYSINIQQKYKLKQDSIWFPFQLNADLFFDMKQSLQLSDDSSNAFMLYGKSKTYIKDIKINPNLKNREFNYIAVEYDNKNNKDTSIWNKYRAINFDKKDIKTYEVIDSIGNELKLDKKILFLSYLMTNKIPISYFNLLFNKIIEFNMAEGFSLGIGAETNNNLSNFAKLGGYFNYGFGDKKWKYAGYLHFNLRDFYDSHLEFNYINDTKEAAGLTFLGRTPLWSKNDFRDFLIENIIYQKKYETAIELRFLYYLKARFFGRFTQNTWFNNYQFRNGNNYLSKIDIPEFGIKLRYAYNEHFIKTPYGIQALPNKYPILYFNITKSLIFDSYNTDYTKISGKFLAKKTIRNWGTSYFNIETGYTWGTIPYFLLFNGQGSYTSFNRGGGINIFNSFGTMKLNEFVNQQFVYLFYKHQFGLLLFRSKYFNPKPGIIQNIGWGELNNKDLHTGIPIKDMHKGFFETGLLIDNIYSDSYSEYGIAIYYRYGAYSYTKWQDNLFFKLSFVYKFMAE